MLGGPVFCEHGRLSDGCEDCALAAAMERGYVHPHQRPAPAPEPERAGADLYVDRGEGRYTLVIAGDVIPASLVNLPRVPRDAPARAVGDKPAKSRASTAARAAGTEGGAARP